MTLFPGIIKCSKTISQVFNPISSLLVYFFYAEIKYSNSNVILQKFLLLLFALILPVSFWIFYHVKKGKYTDTDVSDRHQRKTLYYFITFIMAIYLAVNLYYFEIFDTVIFYLLILLLALQISNFWIKSSMHTALNIFVAGLFLLQNFWLGLLWFVISIIVGYTRILLKRHTLQEVLSGGLIAIIVSGLYFYIN